MMFKNKSERLLRSRLDPYGILPGVYLQPMQPSGHTESTAYRIWGGHHQIGDLMLGRYVDRGGRPCAQMQSLRVHHPDRADYHRSAAIAALAVTAAEGRSLASDEQGSSVEETMLWQWWADEGVADVLVPFQMKLDDKTGQPYFVGQALATPATLIG